MLNDKRKAHRRPIRYAAWIGIKQGELHGCALSDISDSGARIDVEDSKLIPDKFPLFLSNNGAARRMCTVVWRKPKQVGVTFSKRLAAADRVGLTPHPEPETSAPPLAPADGETAPAEST
ncbi:MAG TPA: PilZ domain-containing protein [Pseudolabrys sp.]|nr:PilZ domain-containing protein [Pseudolabrys sp.]